MSKCVSECVYACHMYVVLLTCFTFVTVVAIVTVAIGTRVVCGVAIATTGVSASIV